MDKESFKLYSKDIENGWELIKIKGELDSNTTLYLEDYLKKLLKLNRINIIVDLSETTYINSRGIGILSYFFNECKEKGGNLVLFRPSHKIMTLLKITFLTKVFRVIDDLSDLYEEKNK